MRLRHYRYQTEKTYIHWIKQHIFFHKIAHPKVMGAAEVEAFLTHLAVEKTVAASTQNQALAAFLFLYKAEEWVTALWMQRGTQANLPF